jgi:V/A-type H+-transporting ATPase subunit D
MEQSAFPTKGNRIRAKNTLALARQGYELLDKKRNVLIREILSLNEQAEMIQEKIGRVFAEAYAALQSANIEMGIRNVERLSYGVPRDEKLKVKFRSIMGVEIPSAEHSGLSAEYNGASAERRGSSAAHSGASAEPKGFSTTPNGAAVQFNFGFGNTTVAMDETYQKFNEAKALIIQLAAVENAAHRLAVNIRKTQKRANALKNVTIPMYEARVKEIQETLEERERDEFTRLKVVKERRMG